MHSLLPGGHPHLHPHLQHQHQHHVCLSTRTVIIICEKVLPDTCQDVSMMLEAIKGKDHWSVRVHFDQCSLTPFDAICCAACHLNCGKKSRLEKVSKCVLSVTFSPWLGIHHIVIVKHYVFGSEILSCLKKCHRLKKKKYLNSIHIAAEQREVSVHKTGWFFEMPKNLSPLTFVRNKLFVVSSRAFEDNKVLPVVPSHQQSMQQSAGDIYPKYITLPLVWCSLLPPLLLLPSVSSLPSCCSLPQQSMMTWLLWDAKTGICTTDLHLICISTLQMTCECTFLLHTAMYEVQCWSKICRVAINDGPTHTLAKVPPGEKEGSGWKWRYGIDPTLLLLFPRANQPNPPPMWILNPAAALYLYCSLQSVSLAFSWYQLQPASRRVGLLTPVTSTEQCIAN